MRSYEVFITYLKHCPKPGTVKTDLYDSIDPDADKKNSIVLENNGNRRRIQVSCNGLYLYKTDQGDETLLADDVINRLRDDGFIS